MYVSKQAILDNLNIEAYYREHIQGKITKGNKDWYNCLSPLPGRNEKNPSFGFNVKSGAFKDFTGQEGNIFAFDVLMHGGNEEDAQRRLALRAGLDPDRKETLDERVERYHNNLLQNRDGSLDMINTLGISNTTINDLRLGYMQSYNQHPARIIFPIFDENGQILTLKKYSSTAAPKEKCKFEQGGKNSLYGIHQLNGNNELPVVICAGEKDKSVGESFFRDQFIFVTFTAGEGCLPQGEQLEKAKRALSDRDAVVLYDADEAGQKGGRKVASEFVSIVRSLRLGAWPPEFVEQFPKGDITDFLTKFTPSSGIPCEHLINIINTATPFIPESKDADNNTLKLPNVDLLKDLLVSSTKQCVSIVEDHEGYQKIRATKEGDMLIPMSNFIIIPKEAVEIGDAEVLKCEFVHKNQERVTVIMEKKSWNSKKDFLEKLPSRKYWFAGAERDIQYIKGIVGEYDIPTTQGTNLFGYVKNAKDEGIYVLPDESISLTEDTLQYVPPTGGNPLQSLFSPTIYVDDQRAFLNKLIPTLYNLHDSKPLFCALGWFFATPFKQQIVDIQGHFPALDVFGTRGSGKTTLLAQLLQLFGFEGKMYSCSLTEFRWIKILSSTNCFPVCFDEFKTADLHYAHVDMIKQIVRKAYNQTLEPRGRADQSIVEYPLHAPIIISGESIFQDSAVLDRIVPVHLSFRSLRQEYKDALAEIKTLPLQAFLPIYLEWCLKQDVSSHWDMAKAVVSTENTDYNISDRVIANIATVFFGLDALSRFAASYELPQPNLNPPDIVEYFMNEVTEEKQNRIALDHFLEKLADMAERGHITRNIDYKTEEDIVYLRLKQCVDSFRAWAFRHQYKGEILEHEAYRKMLHERQDVYVETTSTTKRFAGKKQRCVGFNVKKAASMGIELEGFLDS